MKVCRITVVAECGLCDYFTAHDNWAAAHQSITMHVYGSHQDVPEIREARAKDERARKRIRDAQAATAAMREQARPVEDVAPRSGVL